WHNHYGSNVGSRPPRTWNEQVKIVNNTNVTNTTVNVTNIKQNILAVNLKDDSKRKDLNLKFARLDNQAQKQAIDLAKEARHLREERISVERPVALATDLSKPVNGKGAGKTDGVRVAPKERGPRPGTGEPVRFKLPTTQVAEVIKQQEKQAPPKLKQPDSSPKESLPGNLSKGRDPSNRDDGR